VNDNTEGKCFANDLVSWQVTLNTGEVIVVRADAFHQSVGEYIFTVFVEGTPIVMVETVKVPSALVASVYGG
jgi:hypothetical protein